MSVIVTSFSICVLKQFPVRQLKHPIPHSEDFMDPKVWLWLNTLWIIFSPAGGVPGDALRHSNVYKEGDVYSFGMIIGNQFSDK
jgi:hypothetical protein